MTKIVSVGICAYNESKRIPELFRSLLDQELPSDFAVNEILVVASGCTDGTDYLVEEWARLEPRVKLIREPERRGKASAINIILGRYRGDFLVLVNADTRLSPGALAALLRTFERDGRIDLVCGAPFPERTRGVLRLLVEDVWWRLHNRTLQTLTILDKGNHCCDELMALRRGFCDSIPIDIINDGAYLGVLAAQKGITVQFSSAAMIAVDTPRTMRGLLQQRRRVVRGHRQVLEVLGRAPYTLEGLAARSPDLAARILASELFHHPAQIVVFLFVALPLECIAHALAGVERMLGRAFQPAWPTVD